jgi:hypothetical protein
MASLLAPAENGTMIRMSFGGVACAITSPVAPKAAKADQKFRHERSHDTFSATSS